MKPGARGRHSESLPSRNQSDTTTSLATILSTSKKSKEHS